MDYIIAALIAGCWYELNRISAALERIHYRLGTDK